MCVFWIGRLSEFYIVYRMATNTLVKALLMVIPNNNINYIHHPLEEWITDIGTVD